MILPKTLRWAWRFIATEGGKKAAGGGRGSIRMGAVVPSTLHELEVRGQSARRVWTECMRCVLIWATCPTAFRCWFCEEGPGKEGRVSLVTLQPARCGHADAGPAGRRKGLAARAGWRVTSALPQVRPTPRQGPQPLRALYQHTICIHVYIYCICIYVCVSPAVPSPTYTALLRLGRYSHPLPCDVFMTRQCVLALLCPGMLYRSPLAALVLSRLPATTPAAAPQLSSSSSSSMSSVSSVHEVCICSSSEYPPSLRIVTGSPPASSHVDCRHLLRCLLTTSDCLPRSSSVLLVVSVHVWQDFVAMMNTAGAEISKFFWQPWTTTAAAAAEAEPSAGELKKDMSGVMVV